MENKETIVRESRYEYDKDGNMTTMTINETITNPNIDPCDACPYEDGELMTGEIDFTEDETTLANVAFALIGLGLCLTAVATILKRR